LFSTWRTEQFHSTLSRRHEHRGKEDWQALFYSYSGFGFGGAEKSIWDLKAKTGWHDSSIFDLVILWIDTAMRWIYPKLLLYLAFS